MNRKCHIVQVAKSTMQTGHKHTHSFTIPSRATCILTHSLTHYIPLRACTEADAPSLTHTSTHATHAHMHTCHTCHTSTHAQMHTSTHATHPHIHTCHTSTHATRAHIHTCTHAQSVRLTVTESKGWLVEDHCTTLPSTEHENRTFPSTLKVNALS